VHTRNDLETRFDFRANDDMGSCLDVRLTVKLAIPSALRSQVFVFFPPRQTSNARLYAATLPIIPARAEGSYQVCTPKDYTAVNAVVVEVYRTEQLSLGYSRAKTREVAATARCSGHAHVRLRCMRVGGVRGRARRAGGRRAAREWRGAAGATGAGWREEGGCIRRIPNSRNRRNILYSLARPATLRADGAEVNALVKRGRAMCHSQPVRRRSMSHERGAGGANW
jgi:hypothetical protein